MRRIIIASLALLGVVSGAHAAPPSSSWVVVDTKSPTDGSQTYLAKVKSTSTVTNIADKPDYPLFGISCSAKGFFATFAWPDFVDKSAGVTGGSDVVVNWRTNLGPMQTTSFIAADQGAVVIGMNGLKWVNQLKGARKLDIRIPDKHGGQETEFDITGIEAVLTAVNGRNC
jgi:hypothetical protein